MKTLFLFLHILINSYTYSQEIFGEINTSFIQELISSNEHLFKEYLASPTKYEVQIIYSQINRDQYNFPHFTTFTHNLNSKEYFYPASTVKLPAAILALEKINELNIKGLDKDTPLRIDSIENWQTAVSIDLTSSSGLPSIAHYIKKILLVSDNDAYNRLYEFLGQQYLNEKLWGKGLNDCRLVSRLSMFLTPEQNACTNPIEFYSENKVIYFQQQVCNREKIPNKLSTVKRGVGYYYKDSLINEPKDFSNSNYISLDNLHKIIKRLFFPEAFDKKETFNLTDSDYAFIYKYMSMYPCESQYPKYNVLDYPNNFVKFFMFGNPNDSLNQSIRVFNKVGQAYGYLIDNAYIVDFKNGVEFLLSAVIYVNEDQVFNDDKYEYEQIGFPFLSNLGKIIYEFELQRKRTFVPDLIRFKINYLSNE